ASASASASETPTIVPFGAPLDAFEEDEETNSAAPESASRSYASRVGRYLDRADRLRSAVGTGTSASDAVSTGLARGGRSRLRLRESAAPDSARVQTGGPSESGQGAELDDLDMLAAVAPGTFGRSSLLADGAASGGAVLAYEPGMSQEFSWHMPALLGAVLTAAGVLSVWALRPRKPAKTR
ncbi:MAG: hypothetical protein GWP08_18100, partial [Nitrospiraceae bacterium]|nr:hypothetical protein [Nitrospiraceae bacterium]